MGNTPISFHQKNIFILYYIICDEKESCSRIFLTKVCETRSEIKNLLNFRRNLSLETLRKRAPTKTCWVESKLKYFLLYS